MMQTSLIFNLAAYLYLFLSLASPKTKYTSGKVSKQTHQILLLAYLMSLFNRWIYYLSEKIYQGTTPYFTLDQTLKKLLLIILSATVLYLIKREYKADWKNFMKPSPSQVVLLVVFVVIMLVQFFPNSYYRSLSVFIIQNIVYCLHFIAMLTQLVTTSREMNTNESMRSIFIVFWLIIQALRSFLFWNQVVTRIPAISVIIVFLEMIFMVPCTVYVCFQLVRSQVYQKSQTNIIRENMSGVGEQTNMSNQIRETIIK